ncbi:unnamed protein product [Paramecium sonneborni]|uniref:Transmembrane protein n=1 Tax=Paramecium sonneborni TaxID=65129 RepID=A0A8S1N9R5_9CILI|nr:unnamed protein product [Paramecium sonneborni]
MNTFINLDLVKLSQFNINIIITLSSIQLQCFNVYITVLILNFFKVVLKTQFSLIHVYQKIQNNLQMNIQNDEISFKQQPYYFQIIHIKIPKDNLEIERQILNRQNNKNSYFIRNNIKGLSLSVSTSFQNEIYLTSKSELNQEQDK